MMQMQSLLQPSLIRQSSTASTSIVNYNTSSHITDVARSIVRVTCTSAKPSYSRGWQQNKQSTSTATGFICAFNRDELDSVHSYHGSSINNTIEDNNNNISSSSTTTSHQQYDLFIITNAHAIAHQSIVYVSQYAQARRFKARVLAQIDSCDIAILSVDDPHFWGANLKPLQLLQSPPHLNQNVSIVGYQIGGDELCVTKGGVLSQKQHVYAHSGDYYYTIVTDAVLKPGNSGGPALTYNAKTDSYQVLGVAFQTEMNIEHQSYIIPIPIVTHCVRAYYANNIGASSLNIKTQGLESMILRQRLCVPPISALFDYLYDLNEDNNNNHSNSKKPSLTNHSSKNQQLQSPSTSASDINHEEMKDDKRDSFQQQQPQTCNKNNNNNNQKYYNQHEQTIEINQHNNHHQCNKLMTMAPRLFRAQHYIIDSDQDYDHVIFKQHKECIINNEKLSSFQQYNQITTPVYKIRRPPTHIRTLCNNPHCPDGLAGSTQISSKQDNMTSATQHKEEQQQQQHPHYHTTKPQPPPDCQLYLTPEYINDTSIGIKVSDIVPFSISQSLLQKDDVILAINGIPISSDQTILLGDTKSLLDNQQNINNGIIPHRQRIKWTHIVDTTLIGDTVELLISRGFSICVVNIPVEKKQFTAEQSRYEKPSWYCCTGLCFTNLTSNLLEDCYGSNYLDCAPIGLLNSLIENGVYHRESSDEEVVVLTQVLLSPKNPVLIGYETTQLSQVVECNNHKIRNLLHLTQLVDYYVRRYDEYVNNLQNCGIKNDDITNPNILVNTSSNQSSLLALHKKSNSSKLSLKEEQVLLSPLQESRHRQRFDTDLVATTNYNYTIPQQQVTKLSKQNQQQQQCGNDNNHNNSNCRLYRGTNVDMSKLSLNDCHLLHSKQFYDQIDLRYLTFRLHSGDEISVDLSNSRDVQLDVLKRHRIPIPGASPGLIPMYPLQKMLWVEKVIVSDQNINDDGDSNNNYNDASIQNQQQQQPPIEQCIILSKDTSDENNVHKTTFSQQQQQQDESRVNNGEDGSNIEGIQLVPLFLSEPAEPKPTTGVIIPTDEADFIKRVRISDVSSNNNNNNTTNDQTQPPQSSLQPQQLKSPEVSNSSSEFDIDTLNKLAATLKDNKQITSRNQNTIKEAQLNQEQTYLHHKKRDPSPSPPETKKQISIPDGSAHPHQQLEYLHQPPSKDDNGKDTVNINDSLTMGRQVDLTFGGERKEDVEVQPKCQIQTVSATKQ